MIERNVPKPLPEGDHSQTPEGSKEIPSIEKFYAITRRIHDADPGVYISKTGTYPFVTVPGGNRPDFHITFSTQNEPIESTSGHSITFETVAPNGTVIPQRRMYLDTSGGIQIDVELQQLHDLKEIEEILESKDTDVESIDSPTGFPEEIDDVLYGAEDQIYDETDFIQQTGLSAVSDATAIRFMNSLHKLLTDRWPKDLIIPKSGREIAPTDQTVEAFRILTEEMADHTTSHISEWEDEQGRRYSLDTITEKRGNAEVPVKINLSEKSSGIVEGNTKMDTVTSWVLDAEMPSKSDTYELITGFEDDGLTKHNRIELMFLANRMATKIHREKMNSVASIADAATVLRALDALQAKAEHISFEQDDSMEIDVVILSIEPEVGESVGLAITEQEAQNSEKTSEKEKKGKSK